MAISLEEATKTLNQLNAKVQQGDVGGGNDALAEMKVKMNSLVHHEHRTLH